MRFNRTILSILITMLSICVSAQDSAVLSPQLSSAYIDNVSSKSKQVSQKLDKQSRKALVQLQKQEARIQRKLARTDSLKARQIFGNATQSYSQLEQKLQNPGKLQQYIPSLDTIGTSLKFLQQNPQLLSAAKGVPEKIKGAIGKVKGLEDRFQKAEEIKKFLNQRRQYLREQLGQAGFTKELKQLNKILYYYNQHLNEFRALLKDHKKAERKALSLLSQTKLFKDFMRKNSLLASLFRLPGDPGDPLNTAGLAGLQTRVQVNNLVQQQLAAGGAGAQQQFRQHIQDAQSQLNQLKNKVLQSGGSSSDADPDSREPGGFKPNPQKTKSFLQRLELGTNLQSQKTSGYFPATSDIGLSLGYKLNDKSTIGIGASYKIGWGQNIRNISITHQGVGLRSFVDWKIKGSFWLSGGYEMNYRSEFNRVQELRSLAAWQQSGLAGLSKVVSIKSKLLKKTKLQLLWDFLSYRQAPRTQPVILRIGYNF